MRVKMNDRTLMLPLLSMDGFREAFESGGVFKYVKAGLNLNVDFGSKTWSATFNNKAFQKLLALRWGGSRIQVNVGGSPWYNREHADRELHGEPDPAQLTFRQAARPPNPAGGRLVRAHTSKENCDAE